MMFIFSVFPPRTNFAPMDLLPPLFDKHHQLGIQQLLQLVVIDVLRQSTLRAACWKRNRYSATALRAMLQRIAIWVLLLSQSNFDLKDEYDQLFKLLPIVALQNKLLNDQ